MVGLSSDFIRNIERGERKASVDTLVRISKSLNVSVDYLINGINELSETDIENELNHIISASTSNEKLKIIRMIKVMFPHL